MKGRDRLKRAGEQNFLLLSDRYRHTSLGSVAEKAEKLAVGTGRFLLDGVFCAAPEDMSVFDGAALNRTQCDGKCKPGSKAKAHVVSALVYSFHTYFSDTLYSGLDRGV